jgi:hypothetical protein
MEWVDVATHDRQAELAKLSVQLGGWHPKSDTRIVACVVVGRLQASESGLRDLGERAPGVTLQ